MESRLNLLALPQWRMNLSRIETKKENLRHLMLCSILDAFKNTWTVFANNTIFRRCFWRCKNNCSAMLVKTRLTDFEKHFKQYPADIQFPNVLCMLYCHCC